MLKKFYNIEGIIRSGFKLSRDYHTLDFYFVKLGDAGVQALAKSKSIRELRRLILTTNKLGPGSMKELSASPNLPGPEFTDGLP